MAATKMMFISLCLSTLICGSLSYRRYGGRTENPSDRLVRSCTIYERERFEEGKGHCNWKVLEKVAEWDFKSHRDRYMRHLILKARTSGLCYRDGGDVREVRGGCDAMELSCHRREGPPKVIDTCWKLIQARPPGNPSVPTNPKAPGGGGGRGV